MVRAWKVTDTDKKRVMLASMKEHKKTASSCGRTNLPAKALTTTTMVGVRRPGSVEEEPGPRARRSHLAPRTQ